MKKHHFESVLGCHLPIIMSLDPCRKHFRIRIWSTEPYNNGYYSALDEINHFVAKQYMDWMKTTDLFSSAHGHKCHFTISSSLLVLVKFFNGDRKYSFLFRRNTHHLRKP